MAKRIDHRITINSSGEPVPKLLTVAPKDTVTWVNGSKRDMTPLVLPPCLEGKPAGGSFPKDGEIGPYRVDNSATGPQFYWYWDKKIRELKSGTLDVEGGNLGVKNGSSHKEIKIKSDGTLNPKTLPMKKIDTVSWKNQHKKEVNGLKIPVCIDPDQPVVKIPSKGSTQTYSILSKSKGSFDYEYSIDNIVDVRTGTIDVETGE